jgi:diaminopimelate decarboxylase
MSVSPESHGAGPVLAALGETSTPAYVYDLDGVREAHTRLRSALPAPSALYYSVKANPHPAVLAALCAAGCDAEVSSPGEVRAAVTAGYRPDRIIYTGPGKRRSDVVAALRAGVRWFSVDSPAALDLLSAAASAEGTVARALLRLNAGRPGAGHGLAMSGAPSAFGADLEWVLSEAHRFADRPAALVAGLHLYLATNLTDEAALAGQLIEAIAAAELAAASRSALTWVSLGGGFGAPYARAGTLPSFAGLSERLGPHLDRAFPGWRSGTPRLIFESGRYLTATCGSLLVRVLDVKESRGRTVLVLESGINHLGGAAGLRRVPPIRPEPVSGDRAGEYREAILAGPLCTPLDVWSPSATVPAVRPGDLMRVPNVGAYGLSASLLAFLSHPAPAEVVIDHGEVVEVTRLETVRRELPLPDVLPAGPVETE